MCVHVKVDYNGKSYCASVEQGVGISNPNFLFFPIIMARET
jgi:hypothetical protein